MSVNENSNKKQLNGFIALACEIYRTDNRNYTATRLHKEIKEDFEGWTTDMYKTANIRAWREFRETCITSGVSIRPAAAGVSYATVVQEMVEAENLAPWTPQHQTEKLEYTTKYQELLQENGPRGPKIPSSTPEISTPMYQQATRPSGRLQDPAFRAGNGAPEGRGQFNPPGQRNPYTVTGSAQVKEFAQHQPDQPREYHMYMRPELAYPKVEFPAPLSTVVPDYSKQIGNMSKVYSDEKKKYGGEEYEVLNDKLNIFYENCARLRIQQGDDVGYAVVFSLMLKDDAHDFYMSKLYGQNYEFWTMIALMKKQFEVPESAQKYLEEWRSMTLARVTSMPENSTKSKSECVSIMAKKLVLIQRNLTPEYHTDKALRDVLVSAVKDVPECAYAQYNPAETSTALLTQLKSSMSVISRLNPTSASYPTYYAGDNYAQEHNHNTEDTWESVPGIYYVDREYKGNGSSRARGGSYRGGSYGGSYRGNARGGSYQRGPSREKLCYVRKKANHWSTQHTPEERKRAFDSWKRESHHFTGVDHTPGEYRHFLTEVEGEDITAQYNQTPASDLASDKLLLKDRQD